MVVKLEICYYIAWGVRPPTCIIYYDLFFCIFHYEVLWMLPVLWPHCQCWLNGIVGVKTLSGFLHGFERDKLQFFVMWQHTFTGVLAS
jgi:hypothetical protein